MKREVAGKALERLNNAGWSFAHMRNWSGPSDTLGSTTYCLAEEGVRRVSGYVVVVVIDMNSDSFEVYAVKSGALGDMHRLKSPPNPGHTPLVGKMKPGAGAVALANSIKRELEFLVGVSEVSGLGGLA